MRPKEVPVRSAGRGLGEAQLRGKHAQGDLEARPGRPALPACASLIRQQSQTHDALLFPAAKPTNWIEGTHAVLRARKGQDEKVLVATPKGEQKVAVLILLTVSSPLQWSHL